MSRTVLGRIIAILAAYALALQPIAATALVQVFHAGSVTCSGAAPDNAPPASHRQDIACCPSSCCGDHAALPPPAAFVVLLETHEECAAEPAPAFVPAGVHHPRSRAPPASFSSADF